MFTFKKIISLSLILSLCFGNIKSANIIDYVPESVTKHFTKRNVAIGAIAGGIAVAITIYAKKKINEQEKDKRDRDELVTKYAKIAELQREKDELEKENARLKKEQTEQNTSSSRVPSRTTNIKTRKPNGSSTVDKGPGWSISRR